MKQIQIQSQRRFQNISIYRQLQNIIEGMNMQEGVLFVQFPSSSAGLTLMKQNDDLSNDMIYGMEKTFPTQDQFYHYAHTAAHLKSSNMGNTLWILVQSGKILLEENEDIVFCEFLGPKNHTIYDKQLAES